MQYSLEELMEMARRYPAIERELTYDIKPQTDGFQFTFRPHVCILADWEYREEGNALVAESRFTIQGKPAAKIIMNEENPSIIYHVRENSGEYGPARNAYSDGANFNSVYSEMAQNPHLKFPAWDKSEAPAIYAALKKAGCLKNYAADFLLHARDSGLVSGFKNMLILARESGSETLFNDNYGREHYEAKIGYSTSHVACYSGKRLKVEELPHGQKERALVVRQKLESLPRMEEPEADAVMEAIFANTEEGSIMARKEKSPNSDRFYWTLQESDARSDAPYACVEHENIPVREDSPSPA